MKIELITPEQYKTIFDIYTNYPALTLQNKGYEGINKNSFSEEAKNNIKELELILSSHISGFQEFQNFKLDNLGNIKLRFQYDYNYDRNSIPFTGVGYILLDELLNGFQN